MPELAILFMSGYPRGAFSNSDPNSDPNSAPTELLTKPFTYEELAKKVRQALST